MAHRKKLISTHTASHQSHITHEEFYFDSYQYLFVKNLNFCLFLRQCHTCTLHF
jgi:hypothetical protein